MNIKEIKQLLSDGETDAAIRLLDEHIAAHPADDEAWFIRGNAYRKKGDQRQALNNYLRAMELNPESPAAEAHSMLMNIMNYYNKEVYNP